MIYFQREQSATRSLSKPDVWYLTRVARLGGWSGEIITEVDSKISDEDARLLADAIEHVLPDIPEGDKHRELGRAGEWWSGKDLNPLMYWQGSRKPYLQRIAKWVRAGAFDVF